MTYLVCHVTILSVIKKAVIWVTLPVIMYMVMTVFSSNTTICMMEHKFPMWSKIVNIKTLQHFEDLQKWSALFVFRSLYKFPTWTTANHILYLIMVPTFHTFTFWGTICTLMYKLTNFKNVILLRNSYTRYDILEDIYSHYFHYTKQSV